jgi:hypothetical protein
VWARTLWGGLTAWGTQQMGLEKGGVKSQKSGMGFHCLFRCQYQIQLLHTNSSINMIAPKSTAHHQTHQLRFPFQSTKTQNFPFTLCCLENRAETQRKGRRNSKTK